MASLYSLFEQAIALPLEHFAHTFCEGARDFAGVLSSSLSEVPGGELLAGVAREALDALLPAEEKAQAEGQWRMVAGLVEGEEEEGEVEREEEGEVGREEEERLVVVTEGVREEEDAAGSPRTVCAEGDCHEAPSAEPLLDVVHASPAAASAPDQTEQRGTGAAEADSTVIGEEADDSGAREGDEDRSPGASCAEGGYHEAPSAAPLAEAAADPPAASAPHSTQPQKEQRGSGGGGSSSAEGGLFSADAFVLPSDDGTLFSDPLFDFDPLPAADEGVTASEEERAVAEIAGAEAEALSCGEALLPRGVLMETAGAEEVGPREESVAQDQHPVEAARTASRFPPQYASLAGVLEFFPHVMMGTELGKGGQGTVYLADVLSTDRGRFPVATKVPSAGLPGDYLLQEALVCVELQACPNVIPLLGFTVQRGTFIPLYALADPSPAWTQPGAGAQWTPPQLYHIAVMVYQVALGLEGMHNLGWLHG
ncbi:Protein kinase-like superfamily protein [Klebsormidium nitens]|uniref:Protein kinase-like superfamily protein n=1 Tax=Klebsormidium nitens TaxID=105231 RepID=A0A1Y1HXX6_KLENI|nr:Protein kinase-like superfamily protein [Klebsormidium nitens]|eukprot:GAQ83520.1 Protein kinase-like superfamily protein [Klebsormidium nitens]